MIKISKLEGFLKNVSKLDIDTRKIILSEIIGENLVKHTKVAFEKERSIDGKVWAKNKLGTKTLHQHGTLSGSVDYKAGDDSVIIGVNARYGKYHQFGFKHFRSQKLIPARPFFPIDDEGKISEIAINEIKEQTKDLLENHLKSDLKGI